MSTASLSAMAKRLEGKVALITGGAKGMGECMARLFSQHGSKVIIADVLDDLGHSVCKDIGLNSASYVHCDVTNEPDVENVVNVAVTKHGKLDIMVNNAGIIDARKPSIMDNEKSDFKRILDGNVIGVFLGTKHAARVMVPARMGSIVSTASVCGVFGGICTHAYTCSKHAVVGLTRNAAVELGQFGIRVNCVSPYAVGTDMNRWFMSGEELASFYGLVFDGRVLRAQDIAEAALYLASDESRYMNGHNLVVDGGFTIGTSFFRSVL